MFLLDPCDPVISGLPGHVSWPGRRTYSSSGVANFWLHWFQRQVRLSSADEDMAAAEADEVLEGGGVVDLESAVLFVLEASGVGGDILAVVVAMGSWAAECRWVCVCVCVRVSGPVCMCVEADISGGGSTVLNGRYTESKE